MKETVWKFPAMKCGYSSRVTELTRLINDIKIRLADLPQETKDEIDRYVQYCIEFRSLMERHGKAKLVQKQS